MSGLFNAQGQLNASDFQDALQNLVKVASVLQSNVPSNVGLMDSQVSAERRDELITRAITTAEGKLALAQAMANPIRKNLDYQGIGRRALVVDPLTVAA